MDSVYSTGYFSIATSRSKSSGNLLKISATISLRVSSDDPPPPPPPAVPVVRRIESKTFKYDKVNPLNYRL